MTFKDAIKLAYAGKSIRHRNWVKGERLFVEDDQLIHQQPYVSDVVHQWNYVGNYELESYKETNGWEICQ